MAGGGGRAAGRPKDALNPNKTDSALHIDQAQRKLLIFAQV